MQATTSAIAPGGCAAEVKIAGSMSPAHSRKQVDSASLNSSADNPNRAKISDRTGSICTCVVDSGVSGVWVTVGDGLGVEVAVGSGVAVGVGSGSAVGRWVSVGVTVSERVAVGTGVSVGVCVGSRIVSPPQAAINNTSSAAVTRGLNAHKLNVDIIYAHP